MLNYILFLSLVAVGASWGVTTLLERLKKGPLAFIKVRIRVPRALLNSWQGWHDYFCIRPHGRACRAMVRRVGTVQEFDEWVPARFRPTADSVLASFLEKNPDFKAIQPWEVTLFTCCTRTPGDEIGVAVAEDDNFVLTIEPHKPQHGQTTIQMALSNKRHCIAAPIKPINGITWTIPRHTNVWHDHYHVWVYWPFNDVFQQLPVLSDEVAFWDREDKPAWSDAPYSVTLIKEKAICTVPVFYYDKTDIEVASRVPQEADPSDDLAAVNDRVTACFTAVQAVATSLDESIRRIREEQDGLAEVPYGPISDCVREFVTQNVELLRGPQGLTGEGPSVADVAVRVLADPACRGPAGEKGADGAAGIAPSTDIIADGLLAHVEFLRSIRVAVLDGFCQHCTTQDCMSAHEAKSQNQEVDLRSFTDSFVNYWNGLSNEERGRLRWTMGEEQMGELRQIVTDALVANPPVQAPPRVPAQINFEDLLPLIRAAPIQNREALGEAILPVEKINRVMGQHRPPLTPHRLYDLIRSADEETRMRIANLLPNPTLEGEIKACFDKLGRFGDWKPVTLDDGTTFELPISLIKLNEGWAEEVQWLKSALFDQPANKGPDLTNQVKALRTRINGIQVFEARQGQMTTDLAALTEKVASHEAKLAKAAPFPINITTAWVGISRLNLNSWLCYMGVLPPGAELSRDLKVNWIDFRYPEGPATMTKPQKLVTAFTEDGLDKVKVRVVELGNNLIFLVKAGGVEVTMREFFERYGESYLM